MGKEGIVVIAQQGQAQETQKKDKRKIDPEDHVIRWYKMKAMKQRLEAELAETNKDVSNYKDGY